MKSFDLVVVGAGGAGYHAARAAREANSSISILVIHDESHLPYRRSGLSRTLGAPSETDNLILADENWFEKQRIELLQHVTVRAIDRGSRRLVLENTTGEDSPDTVEYGALVMATGADPVIPRVARVHEPGTAHVLRTRDDVTRLIEETSRIRTVLIVGMGVLAVEVADQLHRIDKDVTLLGATPQLMPRQLNPRAGEILEDVLNSRALKLRFLEEIITYERNRKGTWTAETLREKLRSDLVVFCVGVEPRRLLAEAAGLDCGRGIKVNEYLQTSDPAIYAAGDCAEHPDSTISHLWESAAAQGELAGRNAAIETEKSRWSRGLFPLESTVFDQHIYSIGKPQNPAGYEIVEFEDGNRYYGFYYRNNHVDGAIVLNDPDRSRMVTRAVRDNWNREELRDTLGIP